SISRRRSSSSRGVSSVSTAAAPFRNSGWSRYPTGTVFLSFDTATTDTSGVSPRRSSARPSVASRSPMFAPSPTYARKALSRPLERTLCEGTREAEVGRRGGVPDAPAGRAQERLQAHPLAPLRRPVELPRLVGTEELERREAEPEGLLEQRVDEELARRVSRVRRIEASLEEVVRPAVLEPELEGDRAAV